MNEYLNYEIDIIIDETALDVEWLNQATLAMKYSKNWAYWNKKVQQAEEKIKLVRAELIREANIDPDACLGEGVKATGPNIESYYRNHNRHIEAKNEYINATYELHIAESAKKEISVTRKAALTNLVDLYNQNYFIGPIMPRNLSTEVEKRQSSKNIIKNFKRKTKKQ